jgi:choline dehydrogenase
MEHFDYIVVGGGTAGCVLASRLSQDPDARVLLLEAGAARPTRAMADPTAWFTLAGTSVDWAYRTTPQSGTDHAVHAWPRGKVLGGSSGINGMMHIRGDRSSYDAWETAGATGWNYDALLPFFQRTERATEGDPSYRGVDGPMLIAPAPVTEPLWQACYDAAVESGYTRNEDNNGADAEGVSWIDANVVNGVRQSAADAYLACAADRTNLAVLAGAHAQRLLIEQAACRGVEYTVHGRLQRAFAEREVILSAGAIGTPQLLLLSGIGPGGHLRDTGIEPIVDLPGVGSNLHDHPKAEVAYTATRPARTIRHSRKPLVLTRTTPSVAPDIQMIFLDFPLHPRFTPGPENGYSVIFGLMTPTSRGSVRLADADPRRPPLIDPNYLATESDRRRMVAGLRLAREVGAADALAPWRDKELLPGPDTRTDDALLAHLRRSVSTYYHPVGTCKTGTDSMAVVDPHLRVRGIANLRIADASVMPSIVSGNTNAPVLAIAERAAGLVAGEEAGSAWPRPQR